MYKYILVLVLYLLTNNTIWAQQSKIINGKVVDEQNKALVAASVFWDTGTTGAITNEKGEFSIEENKNATFLIASYVGYMNDSIIPKNNTVKFVLKAGVVLESVTVKNKQNSTFSSSLTPMKTQVMGETELQKAACCNLSESFETNPSVDVSFTDAISGTKQIQMLGLAGPYIQISRENMPDIRGLSAIYGLTFVPGTWVESIHLNKGSGSVVNGFESITGQIDVQLKQPTDMDTVFVNLFANQSKRYELNINLQKDVSPKWATATLLHAKTLKQKHDKNNDGFLDMPLGDQVIALHRWQYKGSGNIHSQFGVKATYLHNVGGQVDYKNSQTHDTLNPWGMNLEINRYDAWAKLGKVSKTKPFQSIGFQASGSIHDQSSRFGLHTYNGIQKSAYANLIFQSIIGSTNHKYKTGSSLQYDNFSETYDSTLYNRIEAVPGIFGEYTFSIENKFNVVTGLRADYHSKFGAFITPRIHVRYAPNPKLIIRASAGRGQRTANIFAENTHLFASGRSIEIISNNTEYAYGLEPEVAWNFGGNITKNFRLWYRKGSLSFDAYRTQFTNQVIVDIVQDAEAIKFYNLNGESFSHSMQAQLDYELVKRLDMRIAYRWYDVQSTYNGVLQKKPFVSSHRAFANFAYNTRNNWIFDYTVQWQGEKPLPYKNSESLKNSPSFFVMNAQITKTWRERLDVYIGAENLLGFIQENPIIASTQPYSKSFDSAMIWGPIYGSELYGGIRYTFK